MRYITADEVRRTLTMAAAIRAVREALVELSTGRALAPPRTGLELPGRRTTALVMAAYLPRAGRIGVKLISLCEDNPARGLPLAQTVTVVMDAERGTHINAVGSYKPRVREVPGETVRRAAVFVEERRSALMEAGDILIPLREGLIGEGHIRAEIGEVLAGLKPGRGSEEEITIFKSVGNAVEDLAVAGLVIG
jgi:ornithine cyclodeaminase/alanine dehydrogenase-like protein (mu-crystallin family)